MDFLSIHSDLNKKLLSIKYPFIIGEIKNINTKNGNQYIVITNNNCNITCIKFRGNYNLKEGQNVKLYGKFNIYSANFTINYYVDNYELLDGIGKELTLYEINKKKLIDDNLIFNDKKELLKMPFNIGFLTSETGSVIEDVKSIFKKNNFVGNIILKKTTMQGINCSSSIIEGIEYFKQIDIDILCIFRGGGSANDLEEFNNMTMLYKINELNIFTICAIGHATDNTQLINFVCDMSFETPSIMAEYIVKKQQKYLNCINDSNKLYDTYINKFNNYIEKFKSINIDKKIKMFKLKEFENQYHLSKTKYKNIFNKYNNNKNKLLNKIANIKPTIIKDDKELETIEELYSKPKRMKICCFDGSVEISYKIIE